MKKIGFKIIPLTIIAICLASCLKDLNREPKYGLSTGTVYSNYNDYINLLAKLYGGYTLSGQDGGTGSADISGIDEGWSTYSRAYWSLQEITTDEAVWTYNDLGGAVQQMHFMNWTDQNTFINAAYDRSLYEVTLCNSFIWNCSDANITAHGFSGTQASTIRGYKAEARFLKALALYNALDLFGNPPDITNENNYPGSTLPTQANRITLFNYIQSELLAIEGSLPAPGANQQYRADQACVWALLAHLYLNAQVYTGTAHWADAVTYCNKIISSGLYSLSPSYRDLFLADNGSSIAKQEIIFAFESDGQSTQSYNVTNTLVNGSVGGTSAPWYSTDSFGVAGWNRCLRTTPEFVKQYKINGAAADSIYDTTDVRAMFFRSGQTFYIGNNTITKPAYGYGITKWRNITSTGAGGSNTSFVDTDFPLFRLGDIYLIYAEAALNGAGDMGTALGYINSLEQRAHPKAGYTPIPALTSSTLITERTKEMEWEGCRRQDLIRWGMYTNSTYTWALEGGGADSIGISQPSYLNLYPIPYSDLTSNPNLVQNPGYN